VETSERTDRVILSGTLQELERARVAKRYLDHQETDENYKVGAERLCNRWSGKKNSSHFMVSNCLSLSPFAPPTPGHHHWLDETSLSHIFRQDQLLYFEIASCHREVVTGC